MTRLALVSAALPPSQSGQSMVLQHLLEERDPSSYCLLTQKNFNLYHIQGNFSSPLKANYHFLSPEYQVSRFLLDKENLMNSRAVLKYILGWRERQIARIVRTEGCTSILGCTGNLLDPLAVYGVSKSHDIPYGLYIFDDYSVVWASPPLRALINSLIHEIFGNAAFVIVPNEFLAEKYQKLFGIDPVVIHNPCDLTPYENQKDSTREGGIRIVYTGAIYEAHFDSFRSIVKAIDEIGRPDICLHLYTTQRKGKLNANGIGGANVEVHRHQPLSAMPKIQMGADILYLPLGFRTPYPETIRTSAPGKIGEYLAAGRPILAHAPGDSFLSWYFTKHECGMVVNTDKPAALATSIKSLLEDQHLQKKYCEHAVCRSREDFDIKSMTRKFCATLSKLKAG
jgi:glycosyltransferase involved in cell wall biosynthesis